MVRPILYDCLMTNQIVTDVNNIQLQTTPENSSNQEIHLENDCKYKDSCEDNF